MIRIGVLGYGYWGPNLARNFALTSGCTLAAISDPDPARLALASTRHPGAELSTDPHAILRRPDIDAVALAVPPSLHFPLALEALRNGKHVLVEKPLAESSDHCIQLIDEAAARRLTLMVDHVFAYTPAVAKILELTRQPGFGDILYYDSVRANLGLFQSDVSVLWDLAVHDLSILDRIVPARPVAVSATGINHFQGVENIAYLTLFFDSPLIAHIGVNWLAPVKIRQVLVCGSQRMIVYDDVEPSEKIKVYDKGVNVDEPPTPDNARRIRVNYRTGDMWAPHLDATETLRSVCSHFASCISSGQAPLTGGEAGLRVVRILEAAEASLRQRGVPVQFQTEAVSA
jgi:predicted dehydrogenase